MSNDNFPKLLTFRYIDVLRMRANPITLICTVHLIYFRHFRWTFAMNGSATIRKNFNDFFQIKNVLIIRVHYFFETALTINLVK